MLQCIYVKNKPISYEPKKNEWLIENRNISFEDVLICIEEGLILANLDHSNKKKYKNQKILVIKFQDVAWAVPYEIKEEFIELKTVYPSRKLTKRYLKGVKKNE